MNDKPQQSCCRCTHGGRNLVVCIDGTSNQFGAKNTNVVELYSQLVKSDEQLTYYNSGIGTYAKPSWRSFKYFLQVIENKIDLAIAIHFERIVLGAYRWLVENYRENDRTFLFGFSRGAYQVRALAGMIEKVGLIFKGNEEQIPFAYEIYANGDDDTTGTCKASIPIAILQAAKDDKPSNRRPKWLGIFARRPKRKLSSKSPPMTIPKPLRSQTVMSEGNMKSSTDLAAHFKTTFSRKKVQIHFIGAWDTVSSVGLIREKTLPLTYSADHVCFFRHALALDERRVKFLPEYVHGIKSAPSRAYFTTQTRSPDEYTEINGDTKIGPLRIKEVWFAGTHSDIGGGNRPNLNRDLRNSPFLWMTYEAASIGLRLEATQVGWKWDDIGEVRESLTSVWRIFEWIPFKRLTYKDETSTTYRLHKGHGRKIQRGQKIHASVALCPKDYEPKAKLAFDDKFKWSKIVGRGSITDIKWTIDLKDYLELDIFDYSMAKDITGRLIRSLASNTEIDPQVLFRLSVMVLSNEGCRALLAADSIKSLRTSLRLRSNSERRDLVTRTKVESILRSLNLWKWNDPEIRKQLEHELFDKFRRSLLQSQSVPDFRQAQRKPQRKRSTSTLNCEGVWGAQTANEQHIQALIRLTHKLLRLFPKDSRSLTSVLRQLRMHHIGNRDSPSFRRLITTTCLGVEPDQRLSLLRPRRPSDRQLHLFVNFTDILTGLVKLALDDAVSMSARKIRLCLSALSLILGRGQLGAEGHRYLNVDAKVHDPTREYPGYYVINSDREVSFDQMLRFHIKQWQVATSSTPRGATLILAIGNGTFSKINDVEVFGNLRSMLQKGWRVELFAWDRSLYKIWEDEFGGVGLPWAGRFTLTKLDQFAAELVDISDGERKRPEHDVSVNCNQATSSPLPTFAYDDVCHMPALKGFLDRLPEDVLHEWLCSSVRVSP